MAERTPYEAALEAASSDDERARLQQLRLTLDIPASSPEWGFYAILAPIGRERSDEDRAEFAAARKAFQERTEQRAIVKLLVQPSSAATLYVVVASVLIVLTALLTWAMTTSSDANRFRVDAGQVGVVLTTPSGRAAYTLLKVNGDALATEMQHCKHFTSQGREALNCLFWASGTSVTSSASPSERLADFVAHAPAWPVVLVILIAILVAFIMSRLQTKKHAA